MKSCYLIEPGTPVLVTAGCSTFQPHTTREQLQFDRPASRSATEMTFTKDNWLIRVAIKDVTYCEWDGQSGHSYRGHEIPT